MPNLDIVSVGKLDIPGNAASFSPGRIRAVNIIASNDMTAEQHITNVSGIAHGIDVNELASKTDLNNIDMRLSDVEQNIGNGSSIIIDEVPTFESPNAVSSGGVYDAINAIELTPGPQGPQGVPGPTGPQGPPGQSGGGGDVGMMSRRVLEPGTDFTYAAQGGLTALETDVEITFLQPVGDLDTVELFLELVAGDESETFSFFARLNLSKYNQSATLRFLGDSFLFADNDILFTLFNTEITLAMQWNGNIVTTGIKIYDGMTLAQIATAYAAMLILLLETGTPVYTIKTEVAEDVI